MIGADILVAGLSSAFVRAGRLALIACIGLMALSSQATAQPISATSEPALITADELHHDRDLGLISARGNVELVQSGRTLMADRVEYSERDDRVYAAGDVKLLQPDGNVIFAEYIELTDAMKNGFIRDVKVLFSDNAKFVANEAGRRDGNKMVLQRAVYSPCSLCQDDPKRAPLWQVKSRQVVHDEAKRRVTHHGSALEFFGIPVMYLPYFSHPDPSVKRASGILPPSFSRNQYFGWRVSLPYYQVIDDSTDLVVTPQYSSRQGQRLVADYRQRYRTGEMRVDGSITSPRARDANGNELQHDTVRGHIRADLLSHVSDTDFAGLNLHRTSDITYLTRYGVPQRPYNTLTSRAFYQRVDDRTYAAIQAFGFQSLSSNVRGALTPIAAPIIDYSRSWDPGEYGGRFGLDGNVMALNRELGTDTRRASLTGSWKLPHYTSFGDVYTLTVGVRGDGYWMDDGIDSLELERNNGRTALRAVPFTSLDWRMPLVRDAGPARLIVEPIASVTYMQNLGRTSVIPNEDSRSPEFDDTNLFSINRFPGLDRTDNGARLNYGLRTAALGRSGGMSEAFVGQSVRQRPSQSFALNSGMREEVSDLVTRVMIAPTSYFRIIDRMRISDESFALMRHEVTATVGPPILNFSTTYAALDGGNFVRDQRDREAVTFSGSARLTQNLTAIGSTVQDMSKGTAGPLTRSLQLRYLDECFELTLFMDRIYFVNQDIRPDTIYGLRYRFASFGAGR